MSSPLGLLGLCFLTVVPHLTIAAGFSFGQTQSASSSPPNILLICVDDLRPELGCYGKDYIRSPNMDALAASGTLYERHFVQAPTCGASRYALLTGIYGPSSNGALFQRADRLNAGQSVPVSMPNWFRQRGYRTVSVGKVSHHPGGRGGDDWDDDARPEMPDAWDQHLMPCGPWQHPRGAMHGLANGEIRIKAGEMDLFQSTPGDDSIYPDGLIAETALHQLDTLSQQSQPFFLAVGFIRPHLPFGAPKSYMADYESAELPEIASPRKPSGKSTWHRSGEFMKYNRWDRNPNEDAEFSLEVRKHYAACVTYADAQVGKLIERLKARQLWDNTIVVLWGDHGWHLGEHAIWGKHALFEESLHSPLIIRSPDKALPLKRDARIVETVDIFPTLCQLAGLPPPEQLSGESLAEVASSPVASDGVGAEPSDDAGPDKATQTAVSYFSKARTLRTDRYRVIAHDDGFVELYDHQSDPYETINVASSHTELVTELLDRLDQRMRKSAEQ